MIATQAATPSSDSSSPINPRANVVLTAAAVLLTVAVLATLAAVIIVKRDIVFQHRHTPDTLGLVAATIPGEGAFIAPAPVFSPVVSAAAAQQISTTVEQLPASPERGIRLVSGTHQGLYGVVGQQNSCDAAAITNALDSHSDAAQAWSQVESVQPEQIPYYMNTLTPVLLTADTWVTSHRLAGGRATAEQAVLQAGTAVMIDPAGVPRVRCMSGTPLRPPAAESITALPSAKTSWPGFSPQNVIAVAYTNAPASFTDPVPRTPATEFSFLDFENGNLQSRKAGGTIDIPTASASNAPLPDPIVGNAAP